ncbi:phage tail protein [Desulfocurvibacter africanus]|uniref:phage tail-collar fiber domain-containing protein n=1 Tax=Desulfocurvibacter africanus TaxID=873 RepID=UPI002FD941E4
MANFNGLVLTTAGANLQDKIAVSGATLQFTRAAIGDGLWPAGLDPTSLTGLVSEKKSLAIQGLTDEGTGQHKISVLVDNTGLAVGFMTREIGVFADDPDLGEILYQVTSADSPDYLPPDGGATHIEMALDLLVVTSSTASVTAVINEGLVYARKEDVSAEAAAREAVDDGLAATIAAEVAAREDHEADATAHGSMPTGGIIMWSGAIDAVPQGWALCDGQNGTPDLRGRFIVGAGDSYAVCSTGGSLVTQVRTLTTAQMPSHGHTCAASAQDHEGSGSFGGNSTGRAFNLGTDASGSGQGHSHDYAPPYYALCFIMKL